MGIQIESLLWIGVVVGLLYTPFLIFFTWRHQSIYIGMTWGPAFLVKLVTKAIELWERRHP